MNASTEPSRRKLPNRRYTLRKRADWHDACGNVVGFYVDVGFDPSTGAALEIFLRGRKGKNGTLLSFIGDDIGEMLSLLLQHGYTLDRLAERFKPASLAGFAVATAQALTADDQAARQTTFGRVTFGRALRMIEDAGLRRRGLP